MVYIPHVGYCGDDDDVYVIPKKKRSMARELDPKDVEWTESHGVLSGSVRNLEVASIQTFNPITWRAWDGDGWHGGPAGTVDDAKAAIRDVFRRWS